MSENDTEQRNVKKTKIRMAWKLSLLYSKSLNYLKEKCNAITKANKRLLLEITMFQLFVDVNQLDVSIDTSTSGTDWTSETSLPTSVDISGAMNLIRMAGKRNKKRDLSLEHKLSIAHHYLKSLTENYDVRKRQVYVHYNELLAANENQDLKWKTIQNEINCLISKLGPDVCFPNKKPIEVRDRKHLSSEKWWTLAVCPNDSNRDRLTRATKLENVSLLQQIRNVEVICKYEEKVELAEFLRKMLEKCSFPIEIGHLARKHGRIQFHMDAVKRQMQNLRCLLEKEMDHGEELRGQIARERNMLARVQHSLAMALATTDKERTTDKKLVQLLDDYQGPPILEYIEMNKEAEELNEILKMWQHKVAAAKMVMDMNEQKWRRLNRILVKIKN